MSILLLECEKEKQTKKDPGKCPQLKNHYGWKNWPYLIAVVRQSRGHFADLPFDQDAADESEATTFGVDAVESVDHEPEVREKKLLVSSESSTIGKSYSWKRLISESPIEKGPYD